MCMFLVVLMCFAECGCQSKPKSRPLAEMSDTELAEYNKNAPLEKVNGPVGGYDFGDFLKDTGRVLMVIPVAAFYLTLGWFTHAPVDRGA